MYDHLCRRGCVLPAMWHHARLLRCALLLTSLVTLSGLHVQQDELPTSWSAVRLLPISLFGSSVAAIISYLVSVSDNGKALLYSLTSSSTIFYSVLMFLKLLCHRRQLHRLLRDVGRLEETTALCRRPRDHVFIQRRSAVLAGFSVFALSCWLIGFFVSQDLKHPKYPLDWRVPVMLQSPPWYHLVLALQVIFCTMVVSLQVLVDIVMEGFIDALTLLQERLGRYVQGCLSRSDGKLYCSSGPAYQNVGNVVMEFSHPDVPDSEGPSESRMEEGTRSSGARDPSTHRVANLWNKEDTRLDGTKSGRVQPESEYLPSGRLQVAPDLESRLEVLTETYASIRQFSSDANAFFSIPFLSLHACVTTTLLLGSYVSIMMYRYDDTVSAQVYGFAIFTLAVVVRLMIISSAGSRLIEEGQRLHDTLAAVRSHRGMTSAARFSLQMLVEQTRTPIAFEGWGLLTVQKGTVLSLFSFALTYFVIMMQMKVG